ncbi:MAG: putative SnoaL-like aldol condensation-catalyzing enzyme [Psychromonas sp.]|uniref:nuclear transport factor 2 family protein n=1 Tax=Psychromonas sp. TaxID=1884585 RepID=UPI0039E34A81
MAIIRKTVANPSSTEDPGFNLDSPDALAKADMLMVYSRNHKILGEGNFVLSIGEGLFMNKQVAFYDLFRLQNGKIVEHWDTVQNIPAVADWKNSNGKFGFE